MSIKQLLDCVPDEMGHLKGLYDRGGHWPVELLCDCLGPGPWVLLLSMLTCLLEPVDYQSVNLSASGAMAKRILDEFFAEHGYNPNPAWLVKRLIANGEDCVVPEEDRVEGAEEEVGKSEDDSSGNKAQAECKRDGQTLEQHARTAAETQEEKKITSGQQTTHPRRNARSLDVIVAMRLAQRSRLAALSILTSRQQHRLRNGLTDCLFTVRLESKTVWYSAKALIISSGSARRAQRGERRRGTLQMLCA